jgi:urea transporter/murein DD-endopeptidase MepM/ murein hydrolase activator NlpD
MESSKLVKNFYQYTSKLDSLFKAYSGIFFLPETKLGLAILLLTLWDINIGLSGLLAVASAQIFARFLDFSKEYLRLDYYIYNPLLVGLGIGFLFKLSFLTAVLIATLAVLTFLLTYAVANILGYYLALPVLSIPFVIVSVVAYLASYKYSGLFVYYLYQHSIDLSFFPQWLEGFFKSLGAVIFYPDTLVGLILFLLILYYSRILAFLALVGYFTGILFTASMAGSFSNTLYSDTSAFNYILIALALGGVFLIPHPKSYILALLGVLISVPIVDASKVFFQTYGVPVFAIPFNVVVLLFIYTLSLLGYKYLTRFYKGTPEKTLDYFLSFGRRFPFKGREIGLPFSGRWTVWQSFNGRWTHKGPWRYALDFVITDEEGKTYRGEGYYLTDYYAFRKPVLSPVSGIVTEVVDGYPDNPPGQADKENNWGNYVIIYDYRGFYVLLCHFAQNSIKVKKGDKVEKGTLLGLCGNSGYSPQPHIHMQVQLLPYAGAPTVPFVIDSYITEEGEFKDYSVPAEGEILEAFYPDRLLKDKFNLLLDEEYNFKLTQGSKSQQITLKVSMAPDGTFYLTDGKGKLYFGTGFGTFYIYNCECENDSVLKLLFWALSKLPLNLSKAKTWQDYLPLDVLNIGVLKPLVRFLLSFNHNLFKVENRYAADVFFTYRFKTSFLKRTWKGKVVISKEGKFVEKLEIISEKGKIVLERLNRFENQIDNTGEVKKYHA